MANKLKGAIFNLAQKQVEGEFYTLNFPKLVSAQMYNGGKWTIYSETKNPKLIGSTDTNAFNNTIMYVENLKETMKSNDRIAFSSEILISRKSPLLKKLGAAIKKIAKENNLDACADKVNLKSWRSPLSDGDKKADMLEKRDKNGDKYRDMVVLKVSSKFAVKLYDKYNRPYSPESDDELNGKYCQLQIKLSPYANSSNVGISALLMMVQVRDQNPDMDFGSNPDDVFGAPNAEFGKDKEGEKDTVNDTVNDDGGVPLDDSDDDDEAPFN